MTEIDPSDPAHNWDNYDPEDLVTAKIIRPSSTDDDGKVRIDATQLVEAEKELRKRLTEEQKERRDAHRTEETKKTAQRLSKSITNQPAYLHAFETFQSGATEQIKNAFKKSDFITAATSDDLIRPPHRPIIPHTDLSNIKPEPNRTPEQLDSVIDHMKEMNAKQLAQTDELQAANATLQAQLTEQKNIATNSKTLAANAEEQAEEAKKSAASSKFWAIISAAIAVIGIAVTTTISAVTHNPQTPPQPTHAPSIEQTTD